MITAATIVAILAIAAVIAYYAQPISDAIDYYTVKIQNYYQE